MRQPGANAAIRHVLFRIAASSRRATSQGSAAAMMAPATAMLARAMKRALHTDHHCPPAGDVCMQSISDNKSSSADSMLQRAMTRQPDSVTNCGERIDGHAQRGVPLTTQSCVCTHSTVPSHQTLSVATMCAHTLGTQAQPPLHTGLSPFFNFQHHERLTEVSRAVKPAMPSIARSKAPLARGLEPASSSFDAARPENILSGPGLEEAYALAPAPEVVTPIVTMIRGRFYKPCSQPAKRRHISSAKARGASATTAFASARDPPIMPAGLGRSRSRAGITMPDEEPPALAPTSAEARKRAERNEVERTLSIFTREMAQSLLPFSDAERNQMREETEEEMTERVRSFLLSKSSHLSSMSNARRALLALYDYAASTGVTLNGFDASVGMISAFLSSQAAPTMAASRLQGLKWAKLNYSLALPADVGALKSFSASKSDIGINRYVHQVSLSDRAVGVHNGEGVTF